LGYELVDFELTAQGILRVFIDKEGGITVEDCATVSNHLSRLFMVEDVDYKNLEISSPGLDRPLKKAADFVRFAGQQAKIKTRLPIDGQKNFIGRIEACENDIVTLSFDDKTASIEINNIDLTPITELYHVVGSDKKTVCAAHDRMRKALHCVPYDPRYLGEEGFVTMLYSVVHGKANF